MDFFENVNLYSEFSNLQKQDAQLLFKEFVDKNKNQLETCKNVLDVGCGTGETLVDYMIPSLQVEQLKITGIDVSKEMIKFTREKYGNVNRSFHVFDIQSGLENIDSFVKPASFDLVTSSYCYQWVQDEKLMPLYIVSGKLKTKNLF